jgi:hypothetical protein
VGESRLLALHVDRGVVDLDGDAVRLELPLETFGVLKPVDPRRDRGVVVDRHGEGGAGRRRCGSPSSGTPTATPIARAPADATETMRDRRQGGGVGVRCWVSVRRIWALR